MTYNAAADNAGHEPRAGDYVAFNYSGQIAAGFITRVGRQGRYELLRPTFHIDRVIPDEGKSVVRGGSKCLLVLDRPKETL